MRKLIFFAVFFCALFNTSAQSLNNLNIPTSHPRLFWSSDMLADAQNWYSSNNFPVTNQDTLSIYDGNDAMDLALKYILTDGIESPSIRADYARRAIEWAKLALIEIENEPIDSVNWSGTCNACRWYSERMLLVIDWCFDELTPAEWNMFYNSLNAIVPSWNNATWGNSSMYFSNYNHGYLRQSIQWAFMIYHENDSLAVSLLEDAINNRWYEFEQFTQVGGVGGVPSEGTSYNYSLLHYHIVNALSMKNAGYDYYSETDFFRKAVAHTMYNTTPNQTYNSSTGTNSFHLPYAYGDAGVFANINQWNEPLGAAYSDFMLFASLYYEGIGDLPQYSKGWVDYYDRYNIYTPPSWMMQSVTSHLPEKDITENPLDYFSPEGGELPYGYIKNTWNSSAVTSAFLQLGKAPVGGHEHLDAGSFTLVKGDRFLVVPPAGRGYGSGWQIPDHDGLPTNGVDVQNSLAKNTILFGEAGSAFHAYSEGNVDRMRSHEDYFYVANDLTSTYVTDGSTHPSYTNTNCESFTREFVFFRELEVLVVFDRTLSDPSEDQLKTNVVHTQNEPTLDSPNRYSVINNNYEAMIDILLPSNHSISVIDETEVNGYTARTDNAHRLQIENIESDTVYFLNVYQAKEVGEQAIDVNMSETDSTFLISLGHLSKGYAQVEFFKGIESTKGRIGFDPTGLPYNLEALPDGPHQIVVTDDGPEWLGDQYSTIDEIEKEYSGECGIRVFQDKYQKFYLSTEINDNSNVQLNIFDLSGKIIYDNQIKMNNGKGSFDPPLKSEAIYILDYESENCSGSVKFYSK